MLFKMMFVKYPELLKKLVAELLGIQYGSIGHFEINNSEMPPDMMGDKFCRLDINMTVNGQRVDLEIQVENEGNYPERTLYYWAREYSTALGEGKDYAELPRTIIISIIYFNQFKECREFHSEFQALEVNRHEPLSDKMSLHFYELPKLPETVSAESGVELWLSLFKAKTEEDLRRIEEMGVSVMKEAIGAYRHTAASSEFREMERLRSKARHDEAQALKNERERERKKWQGVVKEKDAALADKNAALADKEAALADKDATIDEQATLIAELLARLGENNDGNK